jgi:guanylate kinase
MILSRVNEQGLRLYDIAYALTTRVRSLQPVERRFPGYILALSGPAGVGKTTVSILLAKVMEEFVVKVPMVTTCAPREGEEGTRRYVSVKEFEHLKRTGDIVSWMRLPPALNEGFLGYLGSDITAIWSEGKIPLVATEMPLLQGLAVHFGRRTILSCGLLPPGQSKRARLSQLLHRLRTRGSETEDQIRLRLAHAERDLKVLDESRGLFDHILVNEDLDTVIATLKGHVLALVAA